MDASQLWSAYKLKYQCCGRPLVWLADVRSNFEVIAGHCYFVVAVAKLFKYISYRSVMSNRNRFELLGKFEKVTKTSDNVKRERERERERQ